MATTLTTTSYDDFPYHSLPFPQTHPDHLATIATLLGLDPAPADRCRVLELGCASGGNLIPMAGGAPASTFVGIDLSQKQIDQGQELVAVLKLANIQLRRMSILDVDDSFGTFDYIICHGVYSWVPEEVRDKILAICAKHLAPNGVGFISYNTYPGWHMRGMLRDMMHYHVHRFPDEAPERRVARARGLLDFLAQSVPTEESPYGLLLRQHLELLQKHSNSYIYHEYLEDCNHSFYFLDFCEQLSRRRLRYLGEAEFKVMVAGTGFPAKVQDVLDELAPNLLEKEQYMDFLRNRTFRQTLVCHAEVQPNYEVRAAMLERLRVASSLRPASANPDLGSDKPEEFKGGGDLTLTTATPIVKAALCVLGEEWPRSLGFSDLCRQAQKRIETGPGQHSVSDAAHTLSKAILTAYATAGGASLQLCLRPSAFSTAVAERPIASPVARVQARTTNQVTNLNHFQVQLSPFDRYLLPFMDGTRNHEELVDSLTQLFRQGDLQIAQGSLEIAEVGRAREILAEVLQQQLPVLARMALLVESA